MFSADFVIKEKNKIIKFEKIKEYFEEAARLGNVNAMLMIGLN